MNDSPHSIIPLRYVHRIGRSGRAGKSGEAMLLLCDFEAFFLRDVKDLPLKPFKAPPGFIGAPQHTGIAYVTKLLYPLFVFR